MSELKSGALLQGGKYRIEKSLGQGGFGITYLAEQTNLNRKVCIKEFFMKEYGERIESSSADATVLTAVSAVTTGAAEIMGKYRDKFIKEAKTIAKLDHPGIVHIHDVFEENGTAYYVMDFVEGENLNDIVKREGPLSEDRALVYIRQIADALSYVHGHNIMHLDVKPANVLVRKSDDKAILIDFGTAKQYDSAGTQTSTTPVGLSAGYAPLELMKVGGVQTFSPETDVYSLGATLYYLVTGQNPPDASERMEMILEGETLRIPTNISTDVTMAIEKALQSKNKRPKTVAEFMSLLPESGAKPQLKRLEFCSNCGEKLSPTAKFCPSCGTKLVEDFEEIPDTIVENIPRGAALQGKSEVSFSSNEKQAYFRSILQSDFPQYTIKENVPVTSLVGDACDWFKLYSTRPRQAYKAEWGEPYTFVLYQSGQPKAVVMLGDGHSHYSGVKFLIARMYAQKIGLPYINFYTQMPNDKSYVVERVSKFLSQHGTPVLPDEKVATEVDAKRQEELRLEREKAEAERKRIAEEKARAEAEANYQRFMAEATEEKEKLKAEEQQRKFKKLTTFGWVFWGLGVLFSFIYIPLLVVICFVIAVGCDIAAWIVKKSD